jgi:hypothetical protein
MMRALAVMSLAALQPGGSGSGSLAANGTCAATEPIRAEPPRDANADPFGTGPWYVNADRSIWAGWDAVRMVAGEKGNKVLWIRPQGTQLVVSGRRLDAEAPPLKARIPCCYPTGFQASGLMFFSGGCWEISAKAGASTLTFVTRVGPDPRGRGRAPG